VASHSEPAPATADTAPGTPPAEGTEARPGPPRRSPGRAILGFFRELPGLLILALILALVIKTLLIQAFYIPSGSMEHTLDIGDRVLVNKVVYHIHPPRRGDIIVFSEPHPLPQPHQSWLSAFAHWLTDGLGVTQSPNKDFIKRVIGLPGNTVEVHNGVVTIDGKALSEHYLGPVPSAGDYGPIKVPEDSLFVMGDNRGDSNDSRGTLGFIPMDKVIGRAFVIIWPPSRIGLLRRPSYPGVAAAPLLVLVPATGWTAAFGRRRARPTLVRR